MKGHVLVADDDGALRLAVKDRLEHWGLTVDEAIDGQAALSQIEKREFDVVLLDLAMPNIGGLEVLRRLDPETTRPDILVLTAHGSIETAVEALKLGATDFLQKPADFDVLQRKIQASLDGRSQRRHLEALADRVSEESAQVLGAAPAMVTLLETAERVAASDATVLVTGESGAGKQVIAEFIHAKSPRAAGPFVYVNCVALSDELIESTLFGHEKGAFTGAVAQKVGRLELAHGGTAFLDEIGDTTNPFQTKLLRFLEKGTYERVGGTKTLSIDCRILCATNRDLRKAIEDEAFRKDLYYRLNVIHLEVPPLRERKEDVPLLARAFADRFAAEQKRGALEITPACMERLTSWSWPGNVRELKNLVERMVTLALDDELTPDLLPDDFFQAPAGAAPDAGDLPYKEAVQAFKKAYLAQALAKTNGNQTQAAEMLGMQRTFLNRLVKELGLRGDDP